MIGLINRAFKKKLERSRDNLSRPHAFPLALAIEGERVRISGVKAGKGLAHRLMNLGLLMGTEVQIRQSSGSGAVIVARGNMRIALGAGMTRKVVVVLADSDDQTHEEAGKNNQRAMA